MDKQETRLLFAACVYRTREVMKRKHPPGKTRGPSKMGLLGLKIQI